MINKRISKITLLSAMLVTGVVNAQEFYTCVPKKNTIMNININNVDELAKAIVKVVPAPTPQQPSSDWKLIKKISFGKVEICSVFGKYKIKFCDEEYFCDLLEDRCFGLYEVNEKYKRDLYKILCNNNELDKLPHNYSCNKPLELYKYE